jgi:16S rRNA processing protein RimM
MDPPERLLEHKTLQIERSGTWVEYRVEERGRSGGVPTAKLAGVGDRDQAAALRGAKIGVPRAALPMPSAKDFYRTDLIGCEVVNQDGVVLGAVRHFVETPAQALMVVRGEREYWVPAVPRHLRRIDLAARRVVVDWDLTD